MGSVEVNSMMKSAKICSLITVLGLYLMLNQGTKNRFFRPIFRRKIGFRWEWIEISMEKIGWKKIGIKSEIFRKKLEKSDISSIFRRLLLHGPRSASGEENVADLSAIN